MTAHETAGGKVEHTPGDLRFDTYGTSAYVFAGEKEEAICDLEYSASDPDAEEEMRALVRANARRIVATWNACRGLTTEQVEGLKVAEVLMTLERVVEHLELLQGIYQLNEGDDEITAALCAAARLALGPEPPRETGEGEGR